VEGTRRHRGGSGRLRTVRDLRGQQHRLALLPPYPLLGGSQKSYRYTRALDEHQYYPSGKEAPVHMHSAGPEGLRSRVS
jgi:hypothetical protein